MTTPSQQPGKATPKQMVDGRARKALQDQLACFDSFLAGTVDPTALSFQAERFGRAGSHFEQDLLAAIIEGFDFPAVPHRLFCAFAFLHFARRRPEAVEKREHLQRATALFEEAVTKGNFNTQVLACILLAADAPPPELLAPLSKLLELPDADKVLTVLAAAALASRDLSDAADSGEPRNSVATAMRVLERCLHSQDSSALHAVAAVALAKLGPSEAEARKALGQLLSLRPHNTSIQAFVLNQIGIIGAAYHDLAPCVTSLVVDSTLDSGLRRQAAEVLGKIDRGPSVRDTLLPFLEYPESPLFLGAVEGLAESAQLDRDAVLGMSKALDSDNEEVRLAAFHGIAASGEHAIHAMDALRGRIGRESSLEALEAMTLALAALGESVGPIIRDMIYQRDFRLLPIVGGTLLQMGPGGVEFIVSRLRDETDPGIRRLFLLVLRDSRADLAPAVPALVELLSETEDEELAGVLVLTLRLSGAAAVDAIPVLTDCLLSRSDDVAFWAGTLLRDLGGRATAALDNAWGAASELQRQRIENAISGLAPGLSELHKRLRDFSDQKTLRQFMYVATILDGGQIPNSDVVARLAALVADGQLPSEAAISSPTLSRVMKRIDDANLVSGPVSSKRHGKTGGLTVHGRLLLRAVRGLFNVDDIH